jgi:hypothetical protein
MPVTSVESEEKRRRGRGTLVLVVVLLPLLALLTSLALAPLIGWRGQVGVIHLGAGRDLSGYPLGFSFQPLYPGEGRVLMLHVADWYWWVGTE